MMRQTWTFLAAALLATTTLRAADEHNRWQIQGDGHTIAWEIQPGDAPHSDHIEMSGEQMAAVIRYGVEADGAFRCERSLVFPLLRTLPNNTHASLMHRIAVDIPSMWSINGLAPQAEVTRCVALNGTVEVTSTLLVGKGNVGAARRTQPAPALEVKRTIFPSPTLPVLCERYEIRSLSDREQTLLIPTFESIYTTPAERDLYGSYDICATLQGSGVYRITPTSEPVIVDVIFSAARAGERIEGVDVGRELAARRAFITEVGDRLLTLETPDEIINTEFRFAKLRASESIIKTHGGYMHAPGGESYYAAIWANDQAEYVNPFFAMLGYEVGAASALNSYRHFARFMNDDYAPIPSSIIAEGDDIWNGAGDRGDAAMIAYGASRYALAHGSRAEAEELWPLIEWCLAYCDRKITAEGVVASDTDELEGRFPAGKANLCTSSLYYDALLSASMLGRTLRKPTALTARYRRQAATLRRAIERHFGAQMGDFATYRYYEGNDLLRSWICIPLTVGIYDRRDGTLDALFSPRLWQRDGLLTQEGSTTYWDRSTLYALRGAFAAGAEERALGYLHDYSAERLVREHVPYPIEAWPEGSQRHLSAESGLYCRSITEGLFGIRPTGLRTFALTPRLPQAWPQMRLRHIKAFGGEFDLAVERLENNKLEVTYTPLQGLPKRYVIEAGATIPQITIE